MTEPMHVPVLAARIVALLQPALQRPGAVLVDATLGMAGHAVALLQAAPNARLVGVDRDPQALQLATARLREAALLDRATLVPATFDEVDRVLDEAGHRLADGGVAAVLMDLGVSSMQLDTDERGFAYSRDTPLDMRMGRDGATAADILDSYDAEQLAGVFRRYSQERFARRIAMAIVTERAVAPLRSSARLVELVYAAVPAAARRTGGHPAKRVFQALRMEVNDELGTLERALPRWLGALRPGGRMAVLSYHSGEDRLVKRAFAGLTQVASLPGLPVEPSPAPYRLLTRGGEGATPEEVEANPRAGSARLRSLERLATGTSHRTQGESP